MFTKFMVRKGYKQSQGDRTLFIKHSTHGKVDLIVYVDDIVVTGDDLSEIGKIEVVLAAELKLKFQEVLDNSWELR